METTLITSEKHFKELKKKYWHNSSYVSYYIDDPKSFPCIAVERHEKSGDLGSIITIDTFVYPEDFRVL